MLGLVWMVCIVLVSVAIRSIGIGLLNPGESFGPVLCTFLALANSRHLTSAGSLQRGLPPIFSGFHINRVRDIPIVDMVTGPRCCVAAYAESHCTSPSNEGHVDGIGWLEKRWKLEKGWGRCVRVCWCFGGTC